MFKRLSTKLTVVYAGLFGATLLALAMIVYAVIADNAAKSVRQELEANGAVFDRVWAMRERQLADSADILARDFGFRDAVATMDAPTIASALDNLRARLQIDRAFLMNLDGDVVGLDGMGAGDLDALWSALDEGQDGSGVLMIEGRPFQAVSAPVRAPALMGWIVFATELNQTHLNAFEELAAIPLQAVVFTRAADQAWSPTDAATSLADTEAFGGELDRLRADVQQRPRRLHLAGGDVVMVAKRLNAFGGGAETALVLSYPMALAMKAYEPVLLSIIVIGLLGVGLLAFGSWLLARSLTRPIAALDRAARALQHGQTIDVAIETDDEIGRLAQSFNVMSNEIAERQAAITHMAMHDGESGLPNRRAMEAALEAGGARFVVAFSIERFREIRDAVGFELALELVAAFGARVREAAHGQALCRLAGDTVAMTLAAQDAAGAGAEAEAARALLEGPLRVGGVKIDVALIAGVAQTEACAETASAEIAALDRAMIAAQQARAAHVKTALFDPARYGDPARNLSLMSEMIEGINRGELELHYQPKFDLRAGAVGGVEALVRWNHPTRGRIAPDTFVAMAEDTGHIAALTEWTLIQAIAHQRVLREAGHDLPISVNLSGRLICDDAFTVMTITLIEDNGADLCLEITETAAMADADAALRNIDRYAEAGVAISIDDYGAGLSSLSYLKRIHAHELKIDKSFIQALEDGPREALLVKSTIDLAHGLGMKITAEGVETQAVFALLGAMGCDTAQGYFVDRPMPFAALCEKLKAEARASECEQAAAAATGVR